MTPDIPTIRDCNTIDPVRLASALSDSTTVDDWRHVLDGYVAAGVMVRLPDGCYRLTTEAGVIEEEATR